MEFIFVQKIIANDSSSSNNSSSSSSDDEIYILLNKRKRRRIKIENNKNYKKTQTAVETAVIPHFPRYDDIKDFQSHFRLDKACVEMLTNDLESSDIQITPGRPGVPVQQCILLTIWTLANQEGFRSIADRFGFSKGNAYKLFLKTCRLLYKKASKYIIWPKEGAIHQAAVEFLELRGPNSFPNVIGCVDGSHILIPGLANDNSYENRKGTHSIILQGICNANQEFIDVFCGWPGSSHDARVWQNSPIYNTITEKTLISSNYHLLGDSAYPLRDFLMVPFKDNGQLTRAQKRFNTKLNETRVTIDQAFAGLKGCWRRLIYLNLCNIENAKYFIVTACIFHNVKRRMVHNEDQDNNDFNEPEVGNENIRGLQEDASGRAKRSQLMTSFEELL